MITSTRYGLGSYIPEAQVDKWALYRVAQYCDELVSDGQGGFEPRFACNLYLQAREQAYKVVQDMASIFRGMAYWSGGAITVTQDAPVDPVYQFAPSNVVDGEFAYQGSSAKARHTVALVTWNDPEDFYRQKVEYVEDSAGIARYGIVQTEVVALGCTSRGQAHRVGKWLLYSEQSESEIVTFRTGLEGAVVRPGDVIKIADPVRGGMRLGGRIAAASTTTVTLDQDLPADLPWRLSVITPGGQVEERHVGWVSGRVVNLTMAFSEAPQAGAIWVLASSIVEPQLFRVVAVAERDPGVHEVTALAHNPGKYAAIEEGLALQPRSITVLSDMPAAPTGLAMQESLYRVKDAAQVLVQLSWAEVPAAIAYRVSYRVNGGNFTSLAATGANYVELRNAQEGEYEFQVRAIGVTRKESVAAALSQTVIGKTAPPSEVTGFAVQRRISDLLLSWDELTDADLAGYEVRVGAGWDSAALVARTAGTQMVHDQAAAGEYPYHIRAVDTSGNYSAHVTTFVLSLRSPSTVRQFDVVQSANRLEFRWQPNPEPEVVGYELREGAAWDASLFVAEVKSTSYTLPSGFDGERRFWVKAIASPGIYSDSPTLVSTVVAQPQNANLIFERDEQALGFPGTKHFASVVSVNGRNALRMATGAQSAEYLFEVDLASPIRAQNTLLARLGASSDDRTTWTEANFPWSSEAARRQWTHDGAIANVEARVQIAREDALQQGELYGWRLSGALDGFGDPAVSESAGTAYAAGRYGQGLSVRDTTRVSWSVSIPAAFHTSFWFIPDEVTTCVIWRASGALAWLLVGYDAATASFFLEDQLSRRVSVPFAVTVTDRICLGVCQAASERRLFVGRMGGEIEAASAALPPVGSFTNLRLY